MTATAAAASTSRESAGAGWVVGVGGGAEEAWAGTDGEIVGRPR